MKRLLLIGVISLLSGLILVGLILDSRDASNDEQYSNRGQATVLTSAISTDLTELAEFFNVPGDPTRVEWVIEQRGGSSSERELPAPSDQSVAAFISYSEASDVTAILAGSVPSAAVESVAVLDWYSGEIKNLATDEGRLKIELHYDVVGADPNVSFVSIVDLPNVLMARMLLPS